MHNYEIPAHLAKTIEEGMYMISSEGYRILLDIGPKPLVLQIQTFSLNVGRIMAR